MIPRRQQRFSAAGLILLASLAVSSRAWAEGACGLAPPLKEPTEEARKVYETALEHTKERRYEEALAAYQRAYDLSPSWVILFNIGKAAELTGDAARAIRAYQCHLEHGGAELDASRQAEVTAAISALKRKVGLVDVQVDERGARVEIDGVMVGTAPLSEPAIVNPGRRLVRASGSKAQSKAIDVAEGARIVVEFDLVDDTPGGTAKKFRFPSALVGVSWITTGLLGVATAVTGILAVVGAKDIEDDVYLGPARVPPSGSDLDDKVERTNALATATDVLLTTLVVTGSAAITFSVVNAVNKPPAPSDATVSIRALPGGAAVRATW